MCTVDSKFASFLNVGLAAAKTKLDNDEREPEYSYFNAMTHMDPWGGSPVTYCSISLKPRIFSQDYMKPAARGGDAG